MQTADGFFACEGTRPVCFPLYSSIGQEAPEAGNQFDRHEAVGTRY